MSKAAHARWKDKDVLIAQHPGAVKIGGYEFDCAVLSDGRRVLSERSVSSALGHKRHPAEYAKRKTKQYSFSTCSRCRSPRM